MKNQPLPWWTWFAPFVALIPATLFSLPFFNTTETYWIYFPVNIAIVMTLWWGPRVLVAVFLNALLLFTLLKTPNPQLYLFYALPETAEVLIAYLLVKEHLKKDSAWKLNPKSLSFLFIYGLLIPSIIGSAAIQILFATTGISDPQTILLSTLITAVGDLTGAVFITVPLLILTTPLLAKKNLTRFPLTKLPPLRWSRVTRTEKMALTGVLSACFILAVSVPLSESWYVYGIVMLLSSAWYGLYAALLMNGWIMGLTIAVPRILNLPWSDSPAMLQTPATLLTLCFCSLITGASVTTFLEKIIVLKKTEADLQNAKEMAEEASAAKSDFLARMSHEIRTPLNSVLGMLELLKETQLNSDQSRYLSLFSHAGENLKALINDLLDFSKIEAKALTVENISYDLHSTVRSVFDILQIKAEEKGLNFELNIDPTVPRMQWGDPTRVRQVLFNLLGNALKFTHEGTVRITIKIQQDIKEKLVLEIDDTGIGIPREKQASIFSPFFQADPSTTRKYGGTGLGLVISKNLVEIMGGTIEMKSLSGRGTVFRVLLPHRPELAQNSEVKKNPTYIWSVQPPTHPFNVLLVDDSEDNRVLMIHYLKNLPFSCDEATNGQEAVQKFKTGQYDIVFMDIQMPLMNGYKATELIRHHEKELQLEHTPIVALTATAVVEDLQKTLKSGCDAYVVKPVKKNQILEILSESLLTKQPPHKPSPPSHDAVS